MNTDEKVKRWIRPSILSSISYHVGDASGLVKLDAMENPYQWPDEVKQAWLGQLANIKLNRYPDSENHNLKNKLRDVFSIPTGQELLLGNGSDEIIQIIVQSMASADTVVIAPEPGFAMYRIIASSLGTKFVGISLNHNDFSIKLDEMLGAIARYQPAVIFLACPNNPTGNLFDESVIQEIVRHAPGLVVLDEAYHVFAESSLMSRIGEHENLVIMNTLSKLGLAGLRLGFLAGPECWLNEFEKVRLPYNINVLTQVSVEFILDHFDTLQRQAQQIRHDREIVYNALESISQVQVWPSKANFLLFRTETVDADTIFAGLKERGVLLKNLHGQHPMLENCLRVTIGTASENKKFLKSLKEII